MFNLLIIFLLGFLPTFGPSYVYLYGSPRDYALFDEHTPLNDGLGEGVMYRGRILMAVKTEILDTLDTNPSNVEVETALPISEVRLCVANINFKRL